MKLWTIRFHGRDERETLSRADVFFLANRDTIGFTREEFFGGLVMSEDGTEAVFVASDRPHHLEGELPSGFAAGFVEGDLGFAGSDES
jgi:hypothetical protein